MSPPPIVNDSISLQTFKGYRELTETGCDTWPSCCTPWRMHIWLVPPPLLPMYLSADPGLLSRDIIASSPHWLKYKRTELTVYSSPSFSIWWLLLILLLFYILLLLLLSSHFIIVHLCHFLMKRPPTGCVTFLYAAHWIQLVVLILIILFHYIDPDNCAQKTVAKNDKHFINLIIIQLIINNNIITI